MEIPVYKFALIESLKNDKQFLPTRAEPKATGWDVKCAEKDGVILKPFEYAKISLGFRSFCPDGWWLSLKPRSSSFGKKSLNCLYGTIDETYEGLMIFACQYIPYLHEGVKNFPYALGIDDLKYYNSNFRTLEIKYGEAIGQLIPVKRQEASMVEASNEELDSLFKERKGTRGVGGFGSTDK